MSLVPRGISWGEGGGVSCQGLVVQGGIDQGKMFEVKSQGENCPGASFIGVQGVIVQEGNYSGVIIQRAKVWRVIFLGGILLGKVVLGVVVHGKIFRGNFPGGKARSQLPKGDFMGVICPGSSCPGGNIRIP